jgi:hypothetical protein
MVKCVSKKQYEENVMKKLSIKILYCIILAFTLSGCITAMRSPFVQKGWSHTFRFEGPYISQVDHEGWGLLRGISLTYQLQYGWAPSGRSGFGHEAGAKFGIDLWQHYNDAESKENRVSELGLLYYLSYTFLDSNYAVKIGTKFPGLYRVVTGVRSENSVFYVHGLLTEPSCYSCDDSKHNVFLGIGVDRPIKLWNSQQINVLFETSFLVNKPWDGGPLHVWRANKQDDNWSDVHNLSFPIIGIGFRL